MGGMIVVGVDPDLKGGIALYNAVSGRVTALALPVVQTCVNRSVRDRVDVRTTLQTFEIAGAMGATHCAIEQPMGLAGQSAAAGVTTGTTFGVLLAAAHASRLIVDDVSASVWKTALRVTSDKDTCVALANKLFPLDCYQWGVQNRRQKLPRYGRAEAALIAYYAHRYLFAQSINK